MIRTERYMSSKTVLSLIGVVFLLMIALYIYISDRWLAAVAAAIVMLIVGFFFATVSGNLVGVIGSSNNPISGLDAFDADHRGAADGVAGRLGTGRRSGGAGSGRGGVRFVRGGGRTDAGFQGRATSWAARRARFRSSS